MKDKLEQKIENWLSENLINFSLFFYNYGGLFKSFEIKIMGDSIWDEGFYDFEIIFKDCKGKVRTIEFIYDNGNDIVFSDKTGELEELDDEKFLVELFVSLMGYVK